MPGKLRLLLLVLCLPALLALASAAAAQFDWDDDEDLWWEEEYDDEEVWPLPGAVAEPVYVELYIPRVEVRSRLLIQMREIFEALGWVVDWDWVTWTIDAKREDLHLVMQIGNSTATVNGVDFYLDVAPRMINSKTFVPLRFVAEVTGAQVSYLGDAVQIIDPDGSVLMVHLLD